MGTRIEKREGAKKRRAETMVGTVGVCVYAERGEMVVVGEAW